MSLWGRKPGASAEPAEPRWRCGDREAEWDPIVRRSGRQEPGVRVAAFGHDIQFWAAELVRLLDHDILIAESRGDDPLVYFCTPEAARRGSSAAVSIGTVAPGSLILLSESELEEPIVLDADAARSFETWVRQLPAGK